MRCSCGKHDIASAGPYETCHFCGHPTSCRPVIDWDLGRLYFSVCHACIIKETVAYESLFVPVHTAPPELVARAYAFGRPLRPMQVNR